MTHEDFISRFEKKMKTARGFMVRCPAHDDGKSSLSVGRARDGGVLLKCFAGCQPKDIVAALGLEMKDLFAEEKAKPFRVVFAAKPQINGKNGEHEKPEIEKVYSYTDALGREVYQALRMKPKSFRQRHAVDGKWAWNMDGVERVLYRLPEVVKAEQVWVVEGEKDADNLAALGLCATCNVGGAGKWLDGYSEFLKGKHVVLCGDNDKPGQDHVNQVFDSVSKRAKSVRIVKVPGVKDVSDFVEALPSDRPAKRAVEELAEQAVPHVGGVRMPVYSMADIEPRYHKLVNLPPGQRVDLSRWLPSFKAIRPLTPGAVVLVHGDTGIGKTMILQNVAMAFPDLKTLMFEMELPDEDLYERFWANKTGLDGREVEQEYQNNGCFGEKSVMSQFPNLFICPESRLTLEQFEAIVLKSELKMGGKPVLVLVDYAQLLLGTGTSRYERASSVAEGIKVIAKATQTIIFVASQVDRASAKDGDIGLHSAKDSGSLENSAGIVIGAHRDKDDARLLTLRVLKATKGGAGLTVLCNIDGAKSRITERSPVAEEAEEPAPRYPE